MKKNNKQMFALFLAAQIATTGFLASCLKKESKNEVEIPRSETSYFSKNEEDSNGISYEEVNAVSEIVNRLGLNNDLLSNESLIVALSQVNEHFGSTKVYAPVSDDIFMDNSLYVKNDDGNFLSAISVLKQIDNEGVTRYYIGMHPGFANRDANEIYIGYNLYRNNDSKDFDHVLISRSDFIYSEDDLKVTSNVEISDGEIMSYTFDLFCPNEEEDVDGDEMTDPRTPLSITLTTYDYRPFVNVEEGTTTLFYVTSEEWCGTKAYPIDNSEYDEMINLIKDGKCGSVLTSLLGKVSEAEDEHQRDYANKYLESSFSTGKGKAYYM